MDRNWTDVAIVLFPWIGGGAAIVFLLLLFGTRLLQREPGSSSHSPRATDDVRLIGGTIDQAKRLVDLVRSADARAGHAPEILSRGISRRCKLLKTQVKICVAGCRDGIRHWLVTAA